MKAIPQTVTHIQCDERSFYRIVKRSMVKLSSVYTQLFKINSV